MRKLAIAMALASTAMATPAVARDHSFYAGLEGGVMWVEDVDFNYADSTGLELRPGATLRHTVVSMLTQLPVTTSVSFVSRASLVTGAHPPMK